MSDKPIKVPGPDHPITLERQGERVVASIAGRVIADSVSTITLREADYPAVEYFPRGDVDMALLEPTSHQTYCPFKGDASYFSIRLDDEVRANAVWSYERPHAAVADIEEYVAFYPDQVQVVTAD